MAQLKDDEWPADNEQTTTEQQERARGCHCDDVPAARTSSDQLGGGKAESDQSKVTNTAPDEATD
jgi:hypothetical protein